MADRNFCLAQENEKYSKTLQEADNYYKQGSLTSSLQLYKQAISSEPDSSTAYVKSGIVEMDLKNYEEAISYFVKSLSINKNAGINAEVYSYKAQCEEKLNKSEEALSDYSYALNINPIYVKALNNRGVLYNKLGKYNNALDDLNKVINLDSSFYMAYNNRGLVYENLSQYQQALDDYNHALRFTSNPDYEIYFNRGVAYVYLGDLQNGLKDFNKAIDLNPKLGILYDNRAMVYYSLKNYDSACMDWKTGSELGNSEAQKYYNQVCLKK